MAVKRDYYIKVKGKWYKVSLEKYLKHNPDQGMILDDYDLHQWEKDNV